MKLRRLLDTVSSMHSLSILLSAMEKSCTTRTALALARRPSSEIIRVHVRVPCILAAATIRGRRLLFILSRSIYSKKSGNLFSNSHTHTKALHV